MSEIDRLKRLLKQARTKPKPKSRTKPKPKSRTKPKPKSRTKPKPKSKPRAKPNPKLKLKRRYRDKATGRFKPKPKYYRDKNGRFKKRPEGIGGGKKIPPPEGGEIGPDNGLIPPEVYITAGGEEGLVWHFPLNDVMEYREVIEANTPSFLHYAFADDEVLRTCYLVLRAEASKPGGRNLFVFRYATNLGMGNRSDLVSILDHLLDEIRVHLITALESFQVYGGEISIYFNE